MPKLIDSFLYFNEEHLILPRFQYLWDIIDHFVVVECNLTHAGLPKPMYFKENEHKFSKYMSKIIYAPFYVDEYKGSWDLENAQRNHIASALTRFDNRDYVIISDADEIPSKGILPNLMHFLQNKNGYAITLVQLLFYYDFHYAGQEGWTGSVLTHVETALQQTPQFLREDNWFERPWKNYHHLSVRAAGWHLSYWNTPEMIQHKIKNFAHQEFNKDEFTDIDYIKNQIKEGKDIFNRNNVSFLPYPEHLIPEDILKLFEKSY